ncbi:hypothetical protein HHK36_021515 [Tetracentron sinense]|uniref:Serine-threonine kinase receptor-associated protein n=1 Tax=Tetracentron sinense TaxID=13715 RepID=A0A835DAQ6_TETSI|nr:hypothetical protein HHK36_021515 [Tetracentron sinense]
MDKKKVAVPLVCHGHSRPVVDLFYSPITPDGFFLISASKDSSPMLRNGETGDWIGTFEGHKGAVWSCCLDTNALRAASGSADFTAKIWDALTGDELHSFEHKHIVRACAFSEGNLFLYVSVLFFFHVMVICTFNLSLSILVQDTHLLLTGGMEKILRIFDLNRPNAPLREVDNSPGSIRTVTWLHSDQTILSSCADMGGVRLWDVRSGKIVQTLETESSVTSAEVSRDGHYITTADGSSVKFWDANHFGLVKSYKMPCIVESASLEPNLGNKFIAGGEDMWIRLFDFHTGEEIGSMQQGSPWSCPLCTFLAWRGILCLGIRRWNHQNMQTGHAIHNEIEAFSANGSAGKVKVTVDEVTQKIEGFHMADSEEKEDATNA